MSRDHLIAISESGLITVTGGKWTTYRRMAEDAVDTAARHGRLPERSSATATMLIHGAREVQDFHAPLYYYGTDQDEIEKLITQKPEWRELLHPDLPYIKAEIIWAVRNEMCITVEDALSRRTRALLLDARASLEAAPLVATLMAKELNHDEEWIRNQLSHFESIAQHYLVH
jgi:glycerol-3-phosphate dehydrogenase